MSKVGVNVSVIVPCYNAVDKIGRCLASLRVIDLDRSDYEVIFVDDCSSDGTFGLLQAECANEKNWRVERLEENSGSPSRPRNLGLTLAQGEYVFFLDCDDEILSDTLKLHCSYALKKKADMVRGYLLVDDGRKRVAMNRLDQWKETLTRKERIEMFLIRQSLTKTCLIRTELLRSNGIKYPEDMRMGEDVVFVSEAICSSSRIEYIDHPTYIYNKLPSLVPSTTQSFGARELRDQLKMWPRLQKLFIKDTINYYKTRFHVNLRYVLSLLINRNRGDINEQLFKEFAVFINQVYEYIDQSNYSLRYKEIIDALRHKDLASFQGLIRPRLLIAGYDLKFIISLKSELEPYFDIRIDEWSGHNQHDEEKSRELLDWAELIWCEWLLGNAVWYSVNKKPHQRLIIRMHRFEIGQDFGENINVENVDAVIAVCVHFFERLLERFPNIPRFKARILPVAYQVADYSRDFHNDRLFTLGMIGILPSRKGFDKALEILVRLRQHDPRYRLEIFGKLPDELSWIATDKTEMAYFGKCKEFIEQNGLSTAVTFHGHSDIKTALSRQKVGYILSTSQSMKEFPGFEAFHTAVGDGFLGGAISLILNYMGCEYVWPKEFILSSVDEIVDHILSYRHDPEAFKVASERGRKFVEQRYSSDVFAKNVKSLFEEVSI